MFDGRTNLSVQVVQEVKKYFGSKVYSTVIPRNIRLAEAPSFGMAIRSTIRNQKEQRLTEISLKNFWNGRKTDHDSSKSKEQRIGKGTRRPFFADQAPVARPEEEKGKPRRQGDQVMYIDINDIRPNENQPRKYFDEEKINELSASIVEHGIIQPLVVRKRKTGYEIVAGERDGGLQEGQS